MSTTSLARPHDNCYWLAPQLLAGEYPGAATAADALPRLRAILDAGVTYFVDLTEPDELEPYALLLPRVVRRGEPVATHLRFPIRDLGVPRSPEAMAAILDAIDGTMGIGQTVYVHCWGGIGRTGTVAGCWLVRHGMSGAAALATIEGHMRATSKGYRVPRSPETDEQCAYVLAWSE
jgi:hypothetical protein